MIRRRLEKVYQNLILSVIEDINDIGRFRSKWIFTQYERYGLTIIVCCNIPRLQSYMMISYRNYNPSSKYNLLKNHVRLKCTFRKNGNEATSY